MEKQMEQLIYGGGVMATIFRVNGVLTTVLILSVGRMWLVSNNMELSMAEHIWSQKNKSAMEDKYVVQQNLNNRYRNNCKYFQFRLKWLTSSFTKIAVLLRISGFLTFKMSINFNTFGLV